MVIYNGTGFDPSAVDANVHFGVQEMREHAGMLGAELNVSSRLGQGTCIEKIKETN